MDVIDLIQTVDVNAFSLIILVILLLAVRNKFEQGMIQYRLFLMLIWLNMTLNGVEILGWIFDASSGASGDLNRLLNLLSNLCLYIAVPIPAAVWFLYAHYQIFHDKTRLRRVTHILLPIIAMNLAISLASIRTGWFFSVNEQNYYARGPYFMFHVLISYGILGGACLMVLINHRLLEARNLRALLLFVVPQVIGGILQIMVFGLSLNWAAMMVAILIVYLNLQDRGLNTDFLTGTYNRRHFEQIITNRIRRIGDDRSFAVILCDMDRFKNINDQFGHQAGDEALQHTVQLMRSTLRKDDLIARFGGDEFYLLLELSNDAALQGAINRIYQVFEQYNHHSHLPYRLELSMGGAIYDPRSELTADRFLRQVDQLMYLEKDRRRLLASNGLHQSPESVH